MKGAIKLLTKSCLSIWKKAICFHLKNQEKMNRNLELVAMLDNTRLKQIVHGRQIPIVVVNNAAKAGFILRVSTAVYPQGRKTEFRGPNSTHEVLKGKTMVAMSPKYF